MANEIDVPKKKKLFDQVGDFWNGVDHSSALGLVLLDECIRRTASKDRDWDALARFVARASMKGNRAKVVKIIRAAFGNSITYTTDKKHAAGGKFTLAWEGAFPLAGVNSYTHVKKAIADNKGWDDAAFLKALGEVILAPEKKAREVDEKAAAKVAKHVTDYLVARMKEGFNVGEVLDAVRKELLVAVKPA